MLKKSKSSIYIINLFYNKSNNNKSNNNFINSFNNRSYKSCNDLINLSNPSLCTNSLSKNKRKILSYGEFLVHNPNSTKKQRIKAIKDFYDNLLK